MLAWEQVVASLQSLPNLSVFARLPRARTHSLNPANAPDRCKTVLATMSCNIVARGARARAQTRPPFLDCLNTKERGRGGSCAARTAARSPHTDALAAPAASSLRSLNQTSR